MAERKPLSKKKRFEIFKRDSFTCQYCGKSAPSVLLEVDHIIPIVEGGDNAIMNLVTACVECNRGKGKVSLSDNSVIQAQKKQLDIINEKRLQLEMLLDWKQELIKFETRQIDMIENLFLAVSEFGFNGFARNKIKSLIKLYGFEEVYASAEISVNKYFLRDTNYYFNLAFEKIGGVCYNRKNGIKGRQ